MPDAVCNFISDECKEFCKNIKHRACSMVIIPTPKQWNGGSLHYILKTNTQKCIDTETDKHIAFFRLGQLH